MFAAVARLGHKLARSYHLVCAHEDLRVRGLSSPVGVWFCERCRAVALDQASFRRHAYAGCR